MLGERGAGGGGLLVLHVEADVLAAVDEDGVEQKNSAADLEERFGFEVAEGEQEDKGGGGVEVEDVAVPDEVAMEHAEEDEPHVAAGVDVGGADAGTAGFGSAGHEDDAGTEEHGEERAHLAFGDDPAGEPEDGVGFPVRSEKTGLMVESGKA